MMRALNTSGTGMVAQQYNLDVIANNLANVNTTGFKAQRAEFQDLMYQTYRAAGAPSGTGQTQPVSLQVGLGTRFSSTVSDFAPGAMNQTGNPTDMAINGQGFFKVLRPDGSYGYTRDGSFSTDTNGLLVNADGMPLQPEITLPAGAGSITISSDGVISALKAGESTVTEIGKLTITMFTNPGGLSRVGQNMYTATSASGTPVDTIPGQNGSGSILQSFTEGSNVQVVTEMERMISAQRAYEINSKAISTADDMLSMLDQLKR